jgi:hypothetical protein
MELFNQEPQRNQNTCKACKFRQRWQCCNSIIQYCGVRKSNRTENGLLKIKCKDLACSLFQSENSKQEKELKWMFAGKV